MRRRRVYLLLLFFIVLCENSFGVAGLKSYVSLTRTGHYIRNMQKERRKKNGRLTILFFLRFIEWNSTS